MMIPDDIGPEIVGLFPSVKSGVVESGLWRIPLYFDKSFGRKRGCIALRRYLVHMAEMGEPKEAMTDKTMEKYEEFSRLIDKFPADRETKERRKFLLDSYLEEFIEEVTEIIASGDSTHVF